jgi:hypothetical protein
MGLVRGLVVVMPIVYEFMRAAGFQVEDWRLNWVLREKAAK